MYEVVLEDENGDLEGYQAEDAKDEQHAVELAKNYYPSLNVIGVMKLEA